MGLKSSRKAHIFLMMAIFLGLLYFGLSGSKWSNGVSHYWNEFDVEFYNNAGNSGTPYLNTVGDIDGDTYPDYIIYDQFEKSLFFNQSPIYEDKLTFTSWDKYLNESIRILNESNAFSNYGMSSIAVYSFNQELANQFLWQISLSELDIMNLEVIHDVNNDGIKDFIVSYGVMPELPDLALFVDQDDYASFFMDNLWLYEEYFIVDYENQTLMITPNYENYDLFVYSGASGSVIERQDLTEIEYNRCVVDIAVLNKTENPTDIPDVALLSSNYSSPRLYSPIYYDRPLGNFSDVEFSLFNYENSQENVTITYFDWQIHALKLNPMEIVWNYIPNDRYSMEESDKWPVYWEEGGFDKMYSGPGMEDMHLNGTMHEASWVDLETSGSNLIIHVHPRILVIDSMPSALYTMYNQNVTTFGMYNGSNGNRLWTRNRYFEYLTNPTDLNGDGFGQLNGIIANNSKLDVLLLDPVDSAILSKARMKDNLSSLINTENMNSMAFTITDDDFMGNDGYFEVLAIGLNQTHYSTTDHENENDPVQLIRFNINVSSQVSLINTSITDFGLNLNGSALDLADDLQILSTNVDLDGDGSLDYLFGYLNTSRNRILKPQVELTSKWTELVSVSGTGVRLENRFLKGAFSASRGLDSDRFQDFRQFSDFTYFFHDPEYSNRICLVSVNHEQMVYVQDLNTFDYNVLFTEFFEGGNTLLYILIALILFCVGEGIVNIIRWRRDKKKRSFNDHKNPAIKPITIAMWIGIIAMLVIITAVVYFFTVSIDLTIGYTTISISPEGQLIWFLILYPATFAALAFLPILYNSLAVFFGKNFFIFPQRLLYRILYGRNKRKEHKIIVVDIPEKNRVAPFTRLGRMLLPILISFTIGTFIYQGLGPNGGIYQMLSPGILKGPLTNPENLGIITENMISANALWVEIGKFARYCILPMIITYIFNALIFPGAWILDDAGICYYERALKTRAVSDIDSVSKFFLNIISGLFGFTAVVSFVQLFIPMITGMDELIQNLQLLTSEPVIFGVIVLVLALIVFPLFAGILFMTASQQYMEENYEKNVKTLHKKVEEMGYNSTPVDLSAVLEAETDEWFSDDEKESKKSQKDYRVDKHKKIDQESNNQDEGTITDTDRNTADL